MKQIMALQSAVLAAMIPVLGVSASESQTLRVAMECGHTPYNWTQESDADQAVPISDSTEYAQGYDIMIARRICEELGWELELWEFDWDALVPVLLSDTVDCVISAQQRMEQWQEEIDYTDDYYIGSAALLVRAEGDYAGAVGLSNLSGISCTALADTVWYDQCLPQIPEAEIASAKTSVPDLLTALQKEKCAAVAVEYQEAVAALAEYPELMVLDFADAADGFALEQDQTALVISVAKDNTELKEAINKVLAEISLEERQQMMEEAQGLWQKACEE
jgi:putative lysine transport system substrate-binding protein